MQITNRSSPVAGGNQRTLDAMASYPAEPFLVTGGAVIAEGEAPPAGFCFPACAGEADCATIFGMTGIPCDVTSGFCDIFVL
jgi:hypothetical protein